MYINMDIYVWLLLRNSMGKEDLRRINDYVIGNKEERQNFEKFRDSSFYQNRPMLKTHLLVQFMNERQIMPACTLHHGIEFVTNFPLGLLEDLCDWAKIQMQQDNTGINSVKFYILHKTLLQNAYIHQGKRNIDLEEVTEGS